MYYSFRVSVRFAIERLYWIRRLRFRPCVTGLCDQLCLSSADSLIGDSLMRNRRWLCTLFPSRLKPIRSHIAKANSNAILINLTILIQNWIDGQQQSIIISTKLFSLPTKLVVCLIKLMNTALYIIINLSYLTTILGNIYIEITLTMGMTRIMGMTSICTGMTNI